MEMKNIDILIIAEGTYPFVRGGVASWINQLINGLSEYTFGIYFIGSRKEDYGEMKYKLPENVKFLKISYLFGDKILPEVKEKNLKNKYFKEISQIHKFFNMKDDLKKENFLKLVKEFLLSDFMYSDTSWNFLIEKYEKKYENESFMDFFWTIRNMHMPLWTLFKDLDEMPNTKIVHSPSTGYAGFFAGLLNLKNNTPYILTEHGIYTRERKIDLLTADWYENVKSIFLAQENLLKQLWNDFYVSIGRFCYLTASNVLSLYNKARLIQIEYGALEEKTKVIPNGVNVHRLKDALNTRDKKVPKVIGLIGRVVPIKDIKTFIKAIKIVSNEIPDVEGWVVGPTEEDPEYFKECKSLLGILDLEKNIKFLGFQNILDIFPKIAINTLTSISEGMPLSVLEGFAAGVPAVTTDVGSCEELIYGALNEEDINIGKAGFVCSVANPKELAQEYIKLLNDEKLWYECQQAGLKRVHEFYTQEMFLENYKELYDRILNGGD